MDIMNESMDEVFQVDRLFRIKNNSNVLLNRMTEKEILKPQGRFNERIFVAAGMGEPTNEKMREQAYKLGENIAKSNNILVHGGFGRGMMGAVLQGYYKHSDNVEMIIPEEFKNDLKGLVYKNAYITNGLAERLHLIQTICAKMFVLPGGTGTLLELLYANEAKRANQNSHMQISVVNTDGFYDGLKMQIETMQNQKFLKNTRVKNQDLVTASGSDGWSVDFYDNVSDCALPYFNSQKETPEKSF